MSIFSSVALARVHTCTCHGVTDARFFPVPCLTHTSLTFQGTVCYLNGWILLVRHEANLSLSLEMLITKSPSTWTSRRNNRRKLIGQIQRKHAGSIRVTEFPNSMKKSRHGRVFRGRGRNWTFSTARQATFIHSFIHCGNYSSGSYCKCIIRWRVKSDE